VIVCLHDGRTGGEILTEEKFGWFAAPSWQHRAGDPCRSPGWTPCGVRAIAEELLDAAGVSWTEIFVAGGVAAVAAAVMAGLDVAALAPRTLRFGAVEVGSPDARFRDVTVEAARVQRRFPSLAVAMQNVRDLLPEISEVTVRLMSDGELSRSR
jgi:hypothetical protein